MPTVDYRTILKTFCKERIRFVVVGGFAAIAHGVVRVTMDLDLVIFLQKKELEKAWQTLKELGFKPRQPIREIEFKDPKILARLAREKNMKAMTFFHEKEHFLVIDLLFGKEFEFSKKDIIRLPLFGFLCPVAKVEKLITLKKRAGREKDLEDIRELKKIKKE